MRKPVQPFSSHGGRFWNDGMTFHRKEYAGPANGVDILRNKKKQVTDGFNKDEPLKHYPE